MTCTTCNVAWKLRASARPYLSAASDGSLKSVATRMFLSLIMTCLLAAGIAIVCRMICPEDCRSLYGMPGFTVVAPAVARRSSLRVDDTLPTRLEPHPCSSLIVWRPRRCAAGSHVGRTVGGAADHGLCALLLGPRRLIRSAIVFKPSTLLRLHRALIRRKYRRLFSSRRAKPGPKGPSRELVAAVVDMKRRNPTWGCPRIAQQIGLAFALPINEDVVRRIREPAVCAGTSSSPPAARETSPPSGQG